MESVNESVNLLDQKSEKIDWKKPLTENLDPVLASMAWAKVHRSIHEDTKPMCFSSKIRHQIGVILEDKFIQYILLFLLFVDIALLFVDLSLEAFYHHKLPEWAQKLEVVTHYATLVILCIFEIELLLLMFSYGLHFVFHPMYVIDWIVVTAAIFFEIIFKDSLIALIPSFLRMWRIIRVSQGILLAGKEIHDKQTEKLNKKIEELEKEIKELKEEKMKIEIK
eukprot:gene8701-647_t